MTESNTPRSLVVRKTSQSTGLSYLSSAPREGLGTKIYVFVHGWGCTSLDCLPLIEALVAIDPTINYIAPDLPGHGESPALLCPRPGVSAFAVLLKKLCHEVCIGQGVQTQAEALTEGELAEKLSGTSPFRASSQALPLVSEFERVLIGHSMGCRVALEVFSQEPANVSGIVLLDGSWYGHSEKTSKPVKRTVIEERRAILKSLETMFGPSTPDQFKERVTKQFQDIDLVYALELGRDYIAWDSDLGRMDEVLQMIREARDNGARVTKVLVIQSTEGRGAMRRSLKKGEEAAWMQLVREAVGERYTGLVVEGSGHWPHVDKTDEVAQAITSFANEL